MAEYCEGCGMNLRGGHRYPFSAIADWLGFSENQTGMVLNVSGSTLARARCHGISREAAEYAAGKIREHPWSIWPEMIDHDIKAVLDPDVHEKQRARMSELRERKRQEATR